MKCEYCGKDFVGGICPFCSKESNNRQTGSADLPILKAETEEKRKNTKMGKTVIIIIIVLLVIAAVITIAAVRGRRKDKPNDKPDIHTEQAGDETPSDSEPDTSPVTFSEDVSLSFEGITLDYADSLDDYTTQAAETTEFKPESTSAFTSAPARPTTTKNHVTPEQHLETTTVKTEEQTKSSDGAIGVIASFFAGTYYFDGSMISEKEKIPFEIAMKGPDYQVFTEMEGMDLCIMRLGGKIYMMDAGSKKYTEINAAVKKMMGITDDMFDFSFNNIKFDASAPASVTKAQLNGKDAVCYLYEDSAAKLEFIAVDDEIRQMTVYNSDGKAETVLVADEFTKDIPEEMFNFKGYSKTNLISFMSSFM